MNYKQLTSDLRAARVAAVKASQGKDGGSANFDTVTIELPRAREVKVEEAAEAAGLTAAKINWIGVRYFIYPPACGIGDSRVRATEAMRDVLRDAGYKTLMYHRMD